MNDPTDRVPPDPSTSRVLDRAAAARLERMSQLAESFHQLRHGVPGVRPFDAQKLARWLKTSGAVTSGSGHAARFVLSVWIGEVELKRDFRGVATFDMHAALKCWDDGHRAAFMAWVRAPWWP